MHIFRPHGYFIFIARDGSVYGRIQDFSQKGEEGGRQNLSLYTKLIKGTKIYLYTKYIKDTFQNVLSEEDFTRIYIVIYIRNI